MVTRESAIERQLMARTREVSLSLPTCISLLVQHPTYLHPILQFLLHLHHIYYLHLVLILLFTCRIPDIATCTWHFNLHLQSQNKSTYLALHLHLHPLPTFPA